MNNQNNKKRAKGSKLVLKSMAWTLIALSLAAIGYFTASIFLG